ncbi:hypothetical protein CP533_1275 [Ophiocordyceps camponoti-saundersi (nom. inval.)]|nr:hypothetical protein CP533_1275 [Ophiocordyceps camponoti-saundersi (nom. inval.)]
MANLRNMLLIWALSAITSAQTPSCKYTVVSGDSCWAIAVLKHSITLDEFRELNSDKANIQKANCPIYPGNVLNVPCQAKADDSTEFRREAGEECLDLYTVKPGDFCWKIAVEKSVSMENLEAWNPKTRCPGIHPGDRMCVSKHKVNCRRYHEVKSNDNCWEVSMQNWITPEKLVSMNRNMLSNASHCPIYAGQKLCVEEA